MTNNTILIIAEDKRVLEQISTPLRLAGHHVDEASTGLAALHYLQSHLNCQLVIYYLQLEEHNSFTLLERISQEHPDVPVITTSTHPQPEIGLEAFRRGAFDYLPLPCGDSHLIATVTSSLDHGLMRRQSLAYRKNLEVLISERTCKLREAMNSLERSYDITLEAMGDALDLRDADTEGHSKRVTAYTIALAKEMNLSPAELKPIARGAFLHDIGKIATPDAILLKPGKLTQQEMDIMREHCRRGYDMLRKIPFLAEAAEIVYAHQESFDGTGYPRGLRGPNIPLGARIFAISDTMDAMTSDRPYRKGMNFEAARAEIKRCRGKQFDPHIVDIYLSMPMATWTTLKATTDRRFEATRLFQEVAA